MLNFEFVTARCQDFVITCSYPSLNPPSLTMVTVSLLVGTSLKRSSSSTSKVSEALRMCNFYFIGDVQCFFVNYDCFFDHSYPSSLRGSGWGALLGSLMCWYGFLGDFCLPCVFCNLVFLYTFFWLLVAILPILHPFISSHLLSFSIRLPLCWVNMLMRFFHAHQILEGFPTLGNLSIGRESFSPSSSRTWSTLVPSKLRSLPQSPLEGTVWFYFSCLSWFAHGWSQDMVHDEGVVLWGLLVCLPLQLMLSIWPGTPLWTLCTWLSLGESAPMAFLWQLSRCPLTFGANQHRLQTVSSLWFQPWHASWDGPHFWLIGFCRVSGVSCLPTALVHIPRLWEYSGYSPFLWVIFWWLSLVWSPRLFLTCMRMWKHTVQLGETHGGPCCCIWNSVGTGELRCIFDYFPKFHYLVSCVHCWVLVAPTALWLSFSALLLTSTRKSEMLSLVLICIWSSLILCLPSSSIGKALT